VWELLVVRVDWSGLDWLGTKICDAIAPRCRQARRRIIVEIG
jgi:hypothetical protein